MNRWLLLAVAMGAALLGAGGMYFAGRMGAPIASDRARTEQIVHDYLVSHPEVLVEASSALRRRQSGQAIDADKAAILEPFGTAWAGNPQGDLTIVEYFDYNCGYCRSTLPAIDALIAGDPKLRVVYRDWPILSPESATAARYSLVAADMGKFAEFHRALYAGGPVSDATLAAAVTTAGQPRVSSGSTTASLGRRCSLSVLTLTPASASVSTAAGVTSLPVPAVVGTQTSGTTGPGTRFSPK